jgi:hypothetical protein
MEAFTKHVLTDHLPHAIILDISDSEDVALWHARWLEKVRSHTVCVRVDGWVL